jgi:hypothetical protein
MTLGQYYFDETMSPQGKAEEVIQATSIGNFVSKLHY